MIKMNKGKSKFKTSKILNIINNKVYFGRTIWTLQKRLQYHIYASIYNTKSKSLFEALL